jgi:hypothetical protein
LVGVDRVTQGDERPRHPVERQVPGLGGSGLAVGGQVDGDAAPLLTGDGDHVAPEQRVGEDAVDEQGRRPLADIEKRDLADLRGCGPAVRFELLRHHGRASLVT